MINILDTQYTNDIIILNILNYYIKQYANTAKQGTPQNDGHLKHRRGFHGELGSWDVCKG